MDRLRRHSTIGLAIAVATVVVVFGRAPTAGAPVREAMRDDEVVEVLPFGRMDPRAREIGALREALAKDPRDADAAAQLAELDIRLARERSDPRHLGYAQAVLAPWSDDAEAPVRILVLRATIEQSLHRFEEALALLDRALEREPAAAQAWLTRATILTVLGRYEEARASCNRVDARVASVATVVCGSQIDSLTGHAHAALRRLDGVLALTRALPQHEEQWVRSVMAEVAVRAGDARAADVLFRRSLELDARDAYTRGAYADLLIDQGRHDDAVTLLAGQDANDGLLLRLAIAESRAKSRAAARRVEVLASRFDASRARGDTVHRREEARFWLELGRDPQRALTLARANWDVQKEPWDARVLLEAAFAADAPADAASVVAFVRETKLEDPAVMQAMSRVTPGDVRRAGTP